MCVDRALALAKKAKLLPLLQCFEPRRNKSTYKLTVLAVQEGNVTVAVLQGDPFIDCYRAWLREKQFSSGTGAEFLSIFSQISGTLSHECHTAQHHTINVM